MTAPHDPDEPYVERLIFGERMVDRIAAIGGSWSFIMGLGVFSVAWPILDTVILTARAFAPFPFIFLNLMSMLAALQAPIIMISRNRHATKDRFDAVSTARPTLARRPRAPACMPRSTCSVPLECGMISWKIGPEA